MTETKSPENKLGPVQVSRERADSHAKDWQRVPKLRASVDAIVASPLAALKKDAVVMGAGGTDAGGYGLVARLPAHPHRRDEAD